MRDTFDTSLAAAFQDVPVPEGLMGRILARLEADRNVKSDNPTLIETPSFSSPAEAPCLAPSKRKISRRWLFVGGGILAAAAALLMAVWLGGHKEESITGQMAIDEAIRAFEAAPEGAGSLLAEKAAPVSFPLSQLVAQVRGTRWRQVEDFLGRKVVVYDLPGPGGARATLYVVAREIEGLRTSPSLHPFTTAGCCASAWQEDGLLYVLVVQGDPSTYGGFLNLPRSPLA
jgi:hypothetical protein